MKAPPSSPVALLSLLLSMPFLLPGCRHTDAIAPPKNVHLPEAEAMTLLGDFRFMCITPGTGRHVAGFGAARDVSAHDLIEALNTQPS